MSPARTHAMSKLLLHFLSKLLHLPKVDTFEGWQKGFLMSWELEVGRWTSFSMSNFNGISATIFRLSATATLPLPSHESLAVKLHFVAHKNVVIKVFWQLTSDSLLSLIALHSDFASFIGHNLNWHLLFVLIWLQ